MPLLCFDQGPFLRETPGGATAYLVAGRQTAWPRLPPRVLNSELGSSTLRECDRVRGAVADRPQHFPAPDGYQLLHASAAHANDLFEPCDPEQTRPGAVPDGTGLACPSHLYPR